MALEYIQDGNLTDPGTGESVPTLWTGESVRGIISHMTRSFIETGPIKVFAGVRGIRPNTMDMLIVWREEDTDKNSKIYQALRGWRYLVGRTKGQEVQLSQVPFLELGLAEPRHEDGWGKILEHVNRMPIHYRQIWPPQVTPVPQQ